MSSQRKIARVKAEKTYFLASAFLEDFNKDEVMDEFFLSESAFQELLGEMQLDRELARQINDKVVILLMKTSSKKEIEDLLVMAEMAING
jgi:hypothetical protein